MKRIRQRDTSVRAEIILPGNAYVAMLGLPGMEINFDGSLYYSPESCELTISYLKAKRVLVLYLMIEDDELPEAARNGIDEHARLGGIVTHWLPVPDYGTPEIKTALVWAALSEERREIMQSGNGIAICCMFGAGRSGMMASALAVETGISVEAAPAFIRSVYPDAIGNKKQEDWVRMGQFLPDQMQA